MFALFTQPDTILPLSQGNYQIQSAKIVVIYPHFLASSIYEEKKLTFSKKVSF